MNAEMKTLSRAMPLHTTKLAVLFAIYPRLLTVRPGAVHLRHRTTAASIRVCEGVIMSAFCTALVYTRTAQHYVCKLVGHVSCMHRCLPQTSNTVDAR